MGGVKFSVLSKTGREAVVAMLGPGEFFGEGCLAGQPVHMRSATATTDSTILLVDKDQMVRLLHKQHALLDRFIAHMLARNIRIEEDLIDQLFNSNEKRLGPDAAVARAIRQARQTRTGRPADLPGDAGGNGRHDAIAGEFLHEEIPAIKETDHTQVAIPHGPICQLFNSHGGKLRPSRAGNLAGGRLVHSDEMDMALLQLWEDSFVYSAWSVRSGKMMPFDNPLMVVRTESDERKIAAVRVRMSMPRFTRLTNGFSKKLESHAATVALYFMYYNFARVHRTLRVTPAMEAGLADHVWAIEEIVALLW